MDLQEKLEEKALSISACVEWNYPNRINDGIVVIYPSWSIDQRYFDTLVTTSINNKIKIRTLYIYDIDDESCRKFENDIKFVSQGRCEMFIIRYGNLIDKINQHDRQNPSEGILNLISR